MSSNRTTIKGKILYIISRRYINKIFRNERLKYEKGRLIFLPLDSFSERRIRERGFEIINLKEFAATEFNNQRAWGLMDTIKSARIDEDVLSDYLVYRNINLIDLIDTEFLIFFLEIVIRQVEILVRLIDNIKPDKVIIASNSHDWLSFISVKFSALSGELIKLVCNSKDIPVINMSSGISIRKFNLICTIRAYLKFIRELVLSINSSVKYFFMHGEKVKNNSKEKIILLNHSLSANTVLPVMNEIRKIQRLDTLLVQISGSLPKLGDEFPRLYKTWDCFFHISVFVKMVMAWFSLKDKIEILRDSNFWEGIKYREVKIGKLIGEIFVYFTGTRLLSAVKFIEMANWLFRKENVKFVVTPEERTLPNRAICAAASFKNIPTLLIQRGLYGNHCLYRFPLLVDKVALEGEWVKQVLIKMGQDISKLEVTGQPAYDLLKEEYTKIDKTAIRSKFNIDTNNIIVLYTSQPLMEGLGVDNSFIPQDISSSHKEEIREICLSLYDRKDILLLIKPHPNESDDLHYQVVNEVKAKNIKVVSRKANIHELISISDILITRHSTTGLEAIVLDKPVIIVDILGDVDSFPYVDYNSALGVYKRENIWPAVKSIFENKQVNDTLKEGRARFIRDFAYQIDGKSSQRIVALINNMMRRTGGIYAS